MNYFDNELKNNFIKLIISFVNNKKDDTIIIKDEDINKYATIANLHKVDMIIYAALKLNEFNLNDKLEKNYELLYAKKITQEAELENIKEAFNNKKIYYMPLKGSIISKYYPLTIYRYMSDLDILIFDDKLKEAGSSVKELGYEEEELGGNHDVYYKKPFMNIELHRALFSPQISFSTYYETLKEKLSQNGYELYFNDNDLYIYLIAHAAKHFISGGAGLRFLLDIYYYEKAVNLNYEYLKNELDKLSLSKFYDVMATISHKLFNEESLNDEEKLILDYLLSSGAYGTYHNNTAANINNNEDIKKAKHKYFLKRVFPDKKTMEYMYPNLVNHSILLPYYYLKRIFRVVFKTKTYKDQLKSINEVNEKEIDKVNKIKEITGVNE